jgi:hypothetical protein
MDLVTKRRLRSPLTHPKIFGNRVKEKKYLINNFKIATNPMKKQHKELTLEEIADIYHFDVLSEKERAIFQGIHFENRTILSYADMYNTNRAHIAECGKTAYTKIMKARSDFNKEAFRKHRNSQYEMEKLFL